MSDQPLRNFKLTIHYDGSEFSGWQIQPGFRTVQGLIQEALERITQARVTLIGAGRTDRGVHALGQVAHFRSQTHLPTSILHRALTGLLPMDIWVAEVEEVPLAFHARFSATSRTYRYQLGWDLRLRSPFFNRYYWRLEKPLEVEELRAGARVLVGEHDFSTFCHGEGARQHRRCRVSQAVWHEVEGGWALEITADRFLRGMVRLIVGALVVVGQRRMGLEEFGRIWEARDHQLAPKAAPARGLFLMRVEYPKETAVFSSQ